MLRNLFSVVVSLGIVTTKSGLNGWLRYAPLPSADNYHLVLASNIIALNTTKTSPVYTASLELQKRIQGIFGQAFKISYNSYKSSWALIIGTIDPYVMVYGDNDEIPDLDKDGF
jgi:alpha-glucuronidase